MDKFTQLKSLMMGYDGATLNWNKEAKAWCLIITDEEKESLMVDTDLDRLINLLLNSDL